MRFITSVFLLLAAVSILVMISYFNRKTTYKFARVPYKITRKSILPSNPSFSTYSYSTNGWDYVEAVDSTSKFNIGQFINK